MAESLKGRKVAFLATDGVEQIELTEPWKALGDAGADLSLVADKEGEIQGVNHGEKADKFRVDKLVDRVTARDFDALVLPGGVRSPDRLRTNAKAVEFVRGFMEADKQVEDDQKLITCRKPDDLPAICQKLVSMLVTAIDERRLDRMGEQSFPASDPPPGPISSP